MKEKLLVVAAGLFLIVGFSLVFLAARSSIKNHENVTFHDGWNAAWAECTGLTLEDAHEEQRIGCLKTIPHFCKKNKNCRDKSIVFCKGLTK